MANINIAYLEIRLSGGPSNTFQNNSLGGAMSSTIVRSKSVTGMTQGEGIVIDDAPGSPDGEGTLTYNNTTKTLTWAPYGAAAGSSVNLTTDGRYAIPGSVGYLFVTVTMAFLPSTNKSYSLIVTQLANQTFDDISRIESYHGDVEFRCFYLYNAHPTDPFIGVKFYIGSQPTGADRLDIGLDSAGIGNGTTSGIATSISNEGSIPSAIAFSRPSVIGSALNVGELMAGEARAFWQRRTIVEQTYTPTLVDISSLVFNVGY